MVLASWVTRAPVRRRLEGDVDLDGNLLAAANHDEVCVLDAPADRVHGEGLGQCQLLLAVDVEGQHRIGAGLAQNGGEVVGVELEVLGLGAVAVQDDGNFAVAAGLARGALAGLVPHAGGEVVGGVLGHEGVLLLPVVGHPHG